MDEGMTPERWRKIEVLFERALRLDPGQRRAFLEKACPDAALRDEVLLLIQHHEAPSSGPHPPWPRPDDNPERNWTGRTLGHFRILEPVGRGGQGQVYLAEDLRLRRRVAIKLLPEDIQEDPVARKRFLREAKSAARLDHPFACSIFEVGEDQGTNFIAMEFVRGETLRGRLSGGRLAMADALKWGLEIAEALDAAHRQGLIHRDLKPSNLMVTESGHIKVMDFGLARRVIAEGGSEQGSLTESLTGTGTAVGTIAYMSPEQLQGKPLDTRSDIFALGLVLFELLTGNHPFGPGSPLETAGAILHRPPRALRDLLPSCPPLLDATVAEMLEKDPERRPQSARAVARRLSQLLKNAPDSPRTAASAAMAFAWEKRVIFGSASLIAVVSVAVWLLRNFTTPPGGPTRVAVLTPAISGSTDQAVLDSVPFAVLEASLNSLTRLRGIEAFDPKGFSPDSDEPAAVQLEMAANEVLQSRITCNSLDCQVSLRRWRDGAIARVSPPIAWSARPQDTLNGADAVQAHLRRLYAEFETVGPQLQVEPEDYRAYLRLKRKREGGEVLDESELGRLEKMTESSPRWLPAYLEAAEAAKALNRIERGLRALRQAERIFPDDPRPLYVRFQLEASSNRLDQAEETLGKLEELLPGDERALKSRRHLLEKRGRLAEAHQLSLGIVERWPSWRNLFDLSILERRLGRMDAARLHLRQLLDRSPENTYGLSVLAGLETKSGDLAEAERLYRHLVEKDGLAEDRGSLCLALYLRGRYDEAVQECEQALQLKPADDSEYSLNLALATGAAGDTERALAIYRRLNQRLDAADAEQLTPRQCIIKAHCLAKLGESSKAREWTRQALTAEAEGWVVYEAALVYAILHARLPDEAEILKAHVLTMTEQALHAGYARHWFSVPEFEPFQADPGFRALLDKNGPR